MHIKSINKTITMDDDHVYVDGKNIEEMTDENEWRFFHLITADEYNDIWNAFKIDVWGSPDLEFDDDGKITNVDPFGRIITPIVREHAEKLAIEFSNVLKSWLTPDEISEVIARNQTPEYLNSCATHDFCDANQAMIDGFDKAFGADIDINNDHHNRVTNLAWDIARNNNFYIA